MRNRVLKGISLHVEALKILNQGFKYGKVHSVFNRTINLINEEGCMISLMSKAMDDAPISIIIDIEDFTRSGIVIGEAVYFNDDKLRVGSKTIDISSASKYNLKRGVFKANSSLLNKNLQTLRCLIDSKGDKEENSFDRMAFEMVISRTKLLQQTCLQENIKGMIVSGRSLMGLGQGLTPSGDDVLMGLFLILGLEGSPMNHLSVVLEKIIEDRMEETTYISYQGLLRASNGFYTSLLVRAVEALTSLENTEDILMEVLSIGHSSGRDLLFGILTGYEILVEKENVNVNANNY